MCILKYFFIQTDSNNSENSKLCSIWHYFSSLACRYYFYQWERVIFTQPFTHSQLVKSLIHNQLYSLPPRQQTYPFPILRGTYFKRTHNRFSQMATSFSHYVKSDKPGSVWHSDHQGIVFKKQKNHLHTHQVVLTQLEIRSCAAHELEYSYLLTGDKVCDSTTLSSHRQNATSICISLCYSESLP